MPTDDFLTDLITEARLEIAKQATGQKLRSAVARGPNRAEARSALLKFQIESEEACWQNQRLIALFTQQACSGCGSTHRTFLQFMHEDRHLRSKALRYQRTATPLYGLPRACMVQKLKTHICADCCQEHGFSPHEPELFLASSHLLTASTSYHAEEEPFDLQEDF